MNLELERDLAEAGMLDFANSLRAAPQARVEDGFADRVMRGIAADDAGAPPPRRRVFWRVALAAAAVLAVAFVFVSLVDYVPPERRGHNVALASCQLADGTFTRSSASPYVQAFAVAALARYPGERAEVLERAVAALVRQQDAEGGWSNASLSARNVAALGHASRAGCALATISYKRGLRYLRTHGIAELSLPDLIHEAEAYSRRASSSADAGICRALLTCQTLLFYGNHAD